MNKEEKMILEFLVGEAKYNTNRKNKNGAVLKSDMVIKFKQDLITFKFKKKLNVTVDNKDVISYNQCSFSDLKIWFLKNYKETITSEAEKFKDKIKIEKK